MTRPRWRTAPASFLSLAAGAVLRALIITPPVSAQETPTKTLFALGDSYSSGEGATAFLAGTNVAGVNECRRSKSAYPVLVSSRAKWVLRFAACSGATTVHVLSKGQQPASPTTLMGAEPQINTIAGATASDVITIGIGGNDAGFGKVVQTCLRSDSQRNRPAG